MNESMDRALTDWLREGPEHGSREGLERALAATRRTSQRPGWTFPERWLPMQRTLARTPSMRPLIALAAIALLVLALAAAAVLIGSSRREIPPPFGVAQNGAVAFERQGDLLIADALDGTERTLVAGPETDMSPVFSNQGDRIAFIREVGDGIRLMSVRPDGSDVKVLGDFPTFNGLSWSPDGSALLINYTETDLSGFRVSVVDADGSGARELDLGTAVDWASWRPGGRHIAFRGRLADGNSGAFIADADGTDVRQLDIASTDVLDFEGLAWSPDGTRLSSMSGIDVGWQIGIADIDADGNLAANRRLRFDLASGDEMLPKWSPDSTQIAFILEKEGVYQIATGRPDGTNLRMVGPRVVDRNGLGYAWAPDGRTLLISAQPNLWSVDAASGAATEVQGATVTIPAYQRLAP